MGYFIIVVVFGLIAHSADTRHKSNKSIKKLHNWQNWTVSVVEFRELQGEETYRLHRDTGASMNLGFLLLAFISQENDWHFLFCVFSPLALYFVIFALACRGRQLSLVYLCLRFLLFGNRIGNNFGWRQTRGFKKHLSSNQVGPCVIFPDHLLPWYLPLAHVPVLSE